MMDVMRPAMLFKKFGLPQETICLITRASNLGLQKRSCIPPRAKEARAMHTHRNMPVQVASAAPQMPQRNTNRNTNSSTALMTDMNTFSTILPRIFPQIRR